MDIPTTSPSVTPPVPMQSTPMQTPPAPVMEKGMSKGILALIIVGVLSFGYLGYAYLTNSGPFTPAAEPMASESPSSSPSPTATAADAGMPGWKDFYSQSTKFFFRYPEQMTVTVDTDTASPGDPTHQWVAIALKGVPLNGLISINNPGSGGVAVSNPESGTVTSRDGTVITYSTGLEGHMGDQPAGPARVWVGDLTVKGNEFSFVLRADDGVDRTELVKSILATFTFN